MDLTPFSRGSDDRAPARWPLCGEEYYDSSKFCRNDGARLEDAATIWHRAEDEPAVDSAVVETPPVVDAPASLNPRVCAHCEAPVAWDEPFCGECGRSVSGDLVPCPYCGGEHPAAVRFCPRTGRALSRWRIAPGNRPWIVVAGLLAAFLALGVWLRPAAGPVARRAPIPAPTFSPVPTSPPARPAAARDLPTADVQVAVQRAAPAVTTLRGFPTASSYEPQNPPQGAFDGDPKTYWHTAGSDRRPSIQIAYPGPRTIVSIGLIVGRIGADFGKTGRVKDVLVAGAGGRSEVVRFDDLPEIQVRTLARPLRASLLRLYVLSTYPGKTPHVAVPEIVVRGY